MFTTEEQQAERISTCRACPKYRKQARYLFGLIKLNKEQCIKCTCLIGSKSAWTDSKCPLNKWKLLQTKS